MEKVIYFDNNATTRIDPRVLDAMMPYLTDNFANASSTHLFGVEAHEAVKQARKQVADLIGAEPHEIVFTSGATEAINTALKGLLKKNNVVKGHVITVETEHPAVLDTCKHLEEEGHSVTYLKVSSEGLIDLDELADSFRSDTVLVAVMMANNETGVIQPIREIADLAHLNGAIFMSDTTQAVGKIAINVDELGIDILCLSAHKIYGPKGVGALYVRKRNNQVSVAPILHGGGHERGMRSGTLNVPGIVGLGRSCELLSIELESNAEFVRNLTQTLESKLLEIEGVKLNGSLDKRLPNTLNIRIQNADSDALILGLSSAEIGEFGVSVSNGSACTSDKIEPSHVLIAMGLSETEAYSSIRLTLGKFNTLSEVSYVAEAISTVVHDLRSMIL